MIPYKVNEDYRIMKEFLEIVKVEKVDNFDKHSIIVLGMYKFLFKINGKWCMIGKPIKCLKGVDKERF